MIELATLILQCAPAVAPATIHAIVRTESGFNPLAMNVNGGVRLQAAPKTAAQAVGWSQWLIDRGYSVDMGLMQINSRNLPALNLTAADMFDPCKNIRAGAAILTADYLRAAKIHGLGNEALLAAVSSYNTGTFDRGFRNGYVAKVMMHAANGQAGPTIDLTCRLQSCSADSPAPVRAASPKPAHAVAPKLVRPGSSKTARARPAKLSRSDQAQLADSAVRGFGVKPRNTNVHGRR